LHERIVRLEKRQQGPSDEQVERVLRKILAERFSDVGVQQVDGLSGLKDETQFLEDCRHLAIPTPVAIDPASLFVDPDDVPSKQYAETFRMLESQLAEYPSFDEGKAAHPRSTETKMKFEVKTPNGLDGV
jgi:hypothetical protein|tara:strand:+ start:2424 stop:2813 length:390 start_codon:yes stop_codon:yes gene_type:complete